MCIRDREQGDRGRAGRDLAAVAVVHQHVDRARFAVDLPDPVRADRRGHHELGEVGLAGRDRPRRPVGRGPDDGFPQQLVDQRRVGQVQRHPVPRDEVVHRVRPEAVCHDAGVQRPEGRLEGPELVVGLALVPVVGVGTDVGLEGPAKRRRPGDRPLRPDRDVRAAGERVRPAGRHRRGIVGGRHRHAPVVVGGGPDPGTPAGVVCEVGLPDTARHDAGPQQPRRAGGALRVGPDVQVLDDRLGQPVVVLLPVVPVLVPDAPPDAGGSAGEHHRRVGRVQHHREDRVAGRQLGAQAGRAKAPLVLPVEPERLRLGAGDTGGRQIEVVGAGDREHIGQDGRGRRRRDGRLPGVALRVDLGVLDDALLVQDHDRARRRPRHGDHRTEARNAEVRVVEAVLLRPGGPRIAGGLLDHRQHAPGVRSVVRATADVVGQPEPVGPDGQSGTWCPGPVVDDRGAVRVEHRRLVLGLVDVAVLVDRKDRPELAAGQRVDDVPERRVPVCPGQLAEQDVRCGRHEQHAAAVALLDQLPGGVAGADRHPVVLHPDRQELAGHRASPDELRLQRGDPVVARGERVHLAGQLRHEHPAVGAGPHVGLPGRPGQPDGVHVGVHVVADQTGLQCAGMIDRGQRVVPYVEMVELRAEIAALQHVECPVRRPAQVDAVVAAVPVDRQGLVVVALRAPEIGRHTGDRRGLRRGAGWRVDPPERGRPGLTQQVHGVRAGRGESRDPVAGGVARQVDHLRGPRRTVHPQHIAVHHRRQQAPVGQPARVGDRVATVVVLERLQALPAVGAVALAEERPGGRAGQHPVAVRAGRPRRVPHQPVDARPAEQLVPTALPRVRAGPGGGEDAHPALPGGHRGIRDERPVGQIGLTGADQHHVLLGGRAEGDQQAATDLRVARPAGQRVRPGRAVDRRPRRAAVPGVPDPAPGGGHVRPQAGRVDGDVAHPAGDPRVVDRLPLADDGRPDRHPARAVRSASDPAGRRRRVEGDAVQAGQQAAVVGRTPGSPAALLLSALLTTAVGAVGHQSDGSLPGATVSRRLPPT